MILEIEEGVTYYSPSGLPFKVIRKGVHYALDCSVHMVVFTNLTPTHDKPTGREWVLDEKLFMKIYRETP